MARERLIPQETPEAVAEQDPDFFPAENGGAFADLVRVTRSRGKPYLVVAPFVLDNTVWYFRGSVHREGIFPYQPLPENEISPLVETEPYTKEEADRLRDKFPQAEVSNSATHEVPAMEAYLPIVLPAIESALKRQNENK